MAKSNRPKNQAVDMNGWPTQYEEMRGGRLLFAIKKVRSRRAKVHTKVKRIRPTHDLFCECRKCNPSVRTYIKNMGSKKL
jgi:hypothetical protein